MRQCGIEMELTVAVDIYLMNWPVAFHRTDDGRTAKGTDGKPLIDIGLTMSHAATWIDMEELVGSGKVRAIGVCNFSIDQLQRLLKYARIHPVLNQIECHPLLPQHEMLAYCQERKIGIMAHSPLGGQRGGLGATPLMQDWRLVSIADKLGVDVAQVLIAWGRETAELVCEG